MNFPQERKQDVYTDICLCKMVNNNLFVRFLKGYIKKFSGWPFMEKEMQL